MFDQFGLREKEQHERLLGATDTDRFVGLIEDQDLAVERKRVRGR